MRYRNLAIHVSNEGQCRRVQEVLFALGYSWLGSTVVRYLSAPARYIYTRDDRKSLTYSTGPLPHMEYGLTNVSAEEFLEEHSVDLFDYSEILSAMSEGEKIQILRPNTGEWEDCCMQHVLRALVDNIPAYAVRVKPRNITVEQWERNYYDPELEAVLLECAQSESLLLTRKPHDYNTEIPKDSVWVGEARNAAYAVEALP